MSEMDKAKIKATKKKKRNKRIKKLVGWLVFLGLLVGAFYLFVYPDLNASATTTYDSYTAAKGTISNSMSFSGSISVVNSETLTAVSAATVRRIYVAEGDTVVAGQKLMRLSDGEVFKADFDGQVNEISVAEEDDIAANASLIQIVDFSNLKVSMRVDENSVSKVSVGQTCKVTVTALSQTFDSTITHINRIASGNNTSVYYTVTAEFSGTDSVLPGMQVTVVIPEEEAADVVILSKDAVSSDAGNSAYVLMKNAAGEMEKVTVELGVSNDSFVEIKSGLSESDVVYVQVKTSTSSSSGLASLFSSLTGGTETQTTTTTSGFPGRGNMPSNFSGGPNGFSGGGGMP